ncbi:MAG TPA: 30S ribosomal protein S13 [Planctomycetota bacterium]|nr:30S ribosomal protein S13 [Planctomycetota bacterium]
MPRISGIDIPVEKQVKISLTYIYGIGDSLSAEILKKAGVNGEVRTKDLSDEEVGRISSVIEAGYPTEGHLKRTNAQNINRLKEINCYRGARHKKNLPVRGQRTKTNARTRKGPRKVVATKKSIKAM